ncbi:MAG: gamma carbonic anhydrase family protein [Pseudomonadales bacterium]|jgi:carbonic anhydrase/acetyltransferase-like protein (isoleucine patch superfamily)|nr:gamma carbonic anhydrase family protein [Pseudomonadales bacterium]MDP7358370.1 gamma carbonic anhydrase family protein [Pseudomonadales bacterium]MDP7594118.1 gamma carbonic anhydrase family protein [Pseudomonadales bacterium]HJN49423.1 gamma carbonic anhydrase family protein [Pseudomonadales bacterium]|tara:strand:+ start:535 stop:1089 length:555 start_codon:yes stop_codon:yes gene_type:complete
MKQVPLSVRGHKGFKPQLGKGVFIDPAAVVTGDVIIGDDASIWPSTVVRGDLLQIRIGARTNIQDGCVIHTAHDGPFNPGGCATTIGDDVTVGHSVTLHGCLIGDRVLVGIGALVLDNAVVETDVMIGAGTLVPPGKKLDSGFLYLGSPCRQARPLTDNEMGYFIYTAGHYVKLKNEHLIELAR